MPDTSPAITHWSSHKAVNAPPWARPGTVIAMSRGFLGRCPSCGKAPLFAGWLRPAEACAACAAPLGEVRADDAPPYVVVFVVGHLVIATQLALDTIITLPIPLEMAVFLPLTLGACLSLLRPVKGAVIGLMLQLGIKGGPDA